MRAAQGYGATPRRVAGGTLAGFLIGLLCGLTIAVVVAVFVTRSPVPFVNKAGHAPGRVIEPGPGGGLPDPNNPLYSKNRPAGSGQPPAPAAEPQPEPDRASILERLFGRSPEPSPPPSPSVGPAPAAPRAPEAPGGPARGSETAPGYLLQAGAFRSPGEADAMRGRVALVGFEARVVSAEVNGQTVYRVRIGPYAQLDEVNKARSRLAENGIEVSVVRQR